MKKQYGEAVQRILHTPIFFVAACSVVIISFCSIAGLMFYKNIASSGKFNTQKQEKNELQARLEHLESKLSAVIIELKEKERQLGEYSDMESSDSQPRKIDEGAGESVQEVETASIPDTDARVQISNEAQPLSLNSDDDNQESGNEQSPAAQENSAPLKYILGVDDVLSVSVWQTPELDKEVVVGPDGTVAFPLLGDIKAAGLTMEQFKCELTRRMKVYMKQPVLSVAIRKLGGKKVMVLGEVNSPGVYGVSGARTIMEAVALAGGFTNSAVASSVILIRGGFDKPHAKRLNLSRVFKGDIKQNIVLESEDIVFVPKKFIANLNYVLSQILDPLSKGAYTAREAQYWGVIK